jgi:8-oxo-dGTP pyrophosphatase MutT (NUDIX family)
VTGDPTPVLFVDVYVLRLQPTGWDVLVLRRAPEGRCAGAWEVVHGRAEPDELPVGAAIREMAEETGLDADRWYNLSRAESFYLHRTHQLAVIPVFAAVVSPDRPVLLSAEHDRFEWLPLQEARARLAWPRERRALDDIAVLLGSGDAGPLEDVLRIR